VCLLVFAWQTAPDLPLMVAANRDERIDRPARSLCVLREAHPRILGGLDELAGGTWLAVNEHGVVAGLTNRPSPGGRDPTKRSRGALPLIAASHRSAEEGVDALRRRVRPGEYNPAWMLVGDRRSLFYVELALDRPPAVRSLEPGTYVLENVALGEPSPKVERILSMMEAAGGSGQDRWEALPSLLADHVLPGAGAGAGAAGAGAPGPGLGGPGGPVRAEVARPIATLACCVHTDDYGTRSAAVLRVPARHDAPPVVLVADGPPCSAPFTEASQWHGVRDRIGSRRAAV